MATKVKFKNGFVEDYTIILSNKALELKGQLTGVSNVKCSVNLNSADILSFDVTKTKLYQLDAQFPYSDIKAYQEYIWESLVDFKVIYVKELDEYFEIRVSLDDSNDVKKTINATSLCEAELSQTMLYNLEINTESDIERDDYVVTVFYNNEKPEASLLH